MIRRYIMLHHSLTKDGASVSWGAIERYHRVERGWADIGYHYGVELIGDAPYALVGRAENSAAAACKEAHMNVLAIHICVVGNYDLLPPPTEVLDVLVKRLLVPLCKRHQILPTDIVGHRDYATYKSCPGLKFNLEEIRRSTVLALAGM